MRIGVAKETEARETRVAATPETVKKFVSLGAEVLVAKGAGLASGVTDADYSAAGAALVEPAEALGADVVLKVRRPNAAEIEGLKPGAIVVAIQDPYGHEAELAALAKAGVSAVAIACRPATPTPIMNALAAGTVPAGVIIIGRARPYSAAASRTAR